MSPLPKQGEAIGTHHRGSSQIHDGATVSPEPHPERIAVGVLEVPPFCIQHQATIQVYNPLCSLRTINNSLSIWFSNTTRRYVLSCIWSSIITWCKHGSGRWRLARDWRPKPPLHPLPQGEHRCRGGVAGRGPGGIPWPGVCVRDGTCSGGVSRLVPG